MFASRQAVRAVAALGILASMLAACSGDSNQSSLPKPSKPFCQAAYDFDTNAPKLVGKLEKQMALVQKMADHAPKDVVKDAQTVLDAYRRIAVGDDSVKDKPEIKSALENVERRAVNGCALYKQNQDGTSGI